MANLRQEDLDENSKAEQFRRAAEFRALAVSQINKLGDYTSSAEILRRLAPRLEEIGLDQKLAQRQLRELADSGLISSKQMGKNFYYLGKGIDPKVLEGKAGTKWKSMVQEELQSNKELSIIKGITLVPREKAAPTQGHPLIGKECLVSLTTPTQERPVPAQEPNLKLDVVKGTNRVRLTINDLVIEIGVVDK
jgi:hypothetical protein